MVKKYQHIAVSGETKALIASRMRYTDTWDSYLRGLIEGGTMAKTHLSPMVDSPRVSVVSLDSHLLAFKEFIVKEVRSAPRNEGILKRVYAFWEDRL